MGLNALSKQFQNVAGALDHFFLVGGGVDELDSVSEPGAVTDDTAKIKFESLVGNQEFEHHAAAWREFARQEEAHAAAAEVAGFAAMGGALSIQKHGHLYRDCGGVALPPAGFFFHAGLGLGGWFTLRHRPFECLVVSQRGQSEDGNCGTPECGDYGATGTAGAEDGVSRS